MKCIMCKICEAAKAAVTENLDAWLLAQTNRMEIWEREPEQQQIQADDMAELIKDEEIVVPHRDERPGLLGRHPAPMPAGCWSRTGVVWKRAGVQTDLN